MWSRSSSHLSPPLTPQDSDVIMEDPGEGDPDDPLGLTDQTEHEGEGASGRFGRHLAGRFVGNGSDQLTETDSMATIDASGSIRASGGADGALVFNSKGSLGLPPSSRGPSPVAGVGDSAVGSPTIKAVPVASGNASLWNSLGAPASGHASPLAQLQRPTSNVSNRSTPRSNNPTPTAGNASPASHRSTRRGGAWTTTDASGRAAGARLTINIRDTRAPGVIAPEPGDRSSAHQLQRLLQQRLKQSVTLAKATSDPNEVSAEDVIEQAQLKEFHPKDDFLDMVKQFGYVSGFLQCLLERGFGAHTVWSFGLGWLAWLLLQPGAHVYHRVVLGACGGLDQQRPGGAL